jgi:glycine/D-amino acid oxidase-like deaminating enzyme
MSVPGSAKFLVIGAGVHGLSTAYHLALELKARRKGGGADILVVDKTGVAAGASGIACGVIRNNYYQPAMRKLMAHSVEVWESDPEAYAYHPVGYLQISPEAMREDVAGIARQQKEIGYTSVFVEGEADSAKYMKGLFHDWRAGGITSVLHEKKGGYANNKKSMQGLAAKARGEGVRILEGVKVTGFRLERGAVSAVETDRGTIRTDFVVAGAGPWTPRIWEMLDLPRTLPIKGRDGKIHENVRMWTYWCLEEGCVGVDPSHGLTNDGKMPPVIHVDTDRPLYSDIDGSLITDKLWGLYYKPDFCFNGVQGGSMPYRIDRDPEEVKVDPYGPESLEFVADDGFARKWCSMLAFCQKRYEGKYPLYRKEPSGGIGAFTPDSFPVFDLFRENCYVIADSNHGYKMIGVGKLVAGEILGQRSDLLEPFRFSRYAEGRLHPVSHSPFPWS